MKVRYTPEAIQKMRMRAGLQAERIKEVETFLSGFDRGFWKGLVERIQERMNDLQTKRESALETMTDFERVANIAAERELRSLLTLPDRASSTLAHLKKEHEDTMGALNARRDATS